MGFVQADSFSLSVFIFLCALMVGFHIFIIKKTAQRFLRCLVVYLVCLGVFSGVVISGVVQVRFLPIAPLLLIFVLLCAVYIALSEIGKRVSDKISLKILTGAQGFRLPLEILLHHWVRLGTVPQTMTWNGQNYDIVSGVLCLFAMPFVVRSRTLTFSAHSISFLLLLNVIRVVVMSSPLPFSWHLDNPILLIAFFPYALIVPLFVGSALAFHLIAFRVMWR